MIQTTDTADAGNGETTYTLTFKDGANGTEHSITTKDGETITLSVPTRSGYTLTGWKDESGEVCTGTMKVTGGATLTAQWSKKSSGTVTPTPTPTPEPEGLPFMDINEEQWFYEAVRYVYDAELMNGVSETAFAPDDTLSRGMVATVLHRLAGAPAGAGESAAFPDVASGAWFAQGVAWAAAEQIVTGYDDGNFYPDGDITREELAVMLWRYAKAEGMDTDTAGDLSAFSDASAVSAWAAEALAWCVEAGILTGRDTGELDPGGTATRAEAAAILMRLCETFAM